MNKLTKEEKMVLYKCDNNIYEVVENYDYLCKHFDNPRDEFFRLAKILKVDKVDWVCISSYQTLSENYISEFKDKVDWERISMFQTLSEDFIREFKDIVDWVCISSFQDLSDEFRKEFNL